jgi:hypothetical protein
MQIFSDEAFCLGGDAQDPPSSVSSSKTIRIRNQFAGKYESKQPYDLDWVLLAKDIGAADGFENYGPTSTTTRGHFYGGQSGDISDVV